MARLCTQCVKPRFSIPPAHRLCVGCGIKYTGKTRKYCTSFCRNTANNKSKFERSGTVIVSEKHCKKCDKVLPYYMFTFDRTKIDGLSSSGCRQCAASRHGEWRKRNPDSIRSGNLMRQYGITIVEYDNILSSQGGVCFLCRQPPKKKRLAVDHDHVTGEIRALLCNYCNKIFVGDATLDSSRRLVAYLSDPPARYAIGVKIVPQNMINPKRRRRTIRHI